MHAAIKYMYMYTHVHCMQNTLSTHQLHESAVRKNILMCHQIGNTDILSSILHDLAVTIPY